MFYKTVHKLYQTEVIGDGKLYHRHVSDSLNSHTYINRVDAAGMNEHRKNFYIMEELLTIRKVICSQLKKKEDNLKNFIWNNPFIVANGYFSRINKGNSCTLTLS